MSQRIHSVDAVRAMALLAILLVHCMDLFGARVAESPAGICDGCCEWIFRHLLISKAFLVFSFLFGLSFFLQMDHAAARGQDFRLRFCWRLVLLLGFGLLHSLFYGGDILVIFALCGFLPVLLWRLPILFSVLLALCCAAQPLMLAEACAADHEAVLRECYTFLYEQGIHLQPEPNLLSASWGEVAAWNVTDGLVHRLLYMIYSGRVFGILAMFLAGMVAGRLRLFEGSPRRLLSLAVPMGLLYAACLAGQAMASLAWQPVVAWWGNAAYSLSLIAWLGFFFSHAALLRCVQPLASIGRCTLSCYIGQSLVMCSLLYGWGLGLAEQLSFTARTALGLAFFFVQLLLCSCWLRSFRYGPLEGIWRRLTRLGMH